MYITHEYSSWSYNGVRRTCTHPGGSSIYVQYYDLQQQRTVTKVYKCNVCGEPLQMNPKRNIVGFADRHCRIGGMIIARA